MLNVAYSKGCTVKSQLTFDRKLKIVLSFTLAHNI